METSFGTYRRYKDGTSKILEWLSKNAISCGYKSQDSAQVKDQPGKAKSKTAANGKVPLKEIPLMAEFIATAVPKPDIPSWLVKLTQEVIALRKKAARFYYRKAGSSSASNSKQKNVGHLHFIGILENVLDILAPNIKTSTNTNSDEADSGQLHSVFEALTIDDPAKLDEHRTSSPAGSATKEQAANAVPPYELEDDDEDVHWLIWCFFNDFNAVRHHLRNTWTRYKEGELDLATAATITNTAFELFQSAETEFLSVLPKKANISDYNSLSRFVINTAASLREITLPKGPQLDDFMSVELFDISEFIGSTTNMVLQGFLRQVHPSTVPVPKKGFYKGPDLSGRPLSIQQTWFQNATILLKNILPELCILERGFSVQIPGEDELTKGAINMVKTKIIPIWLVLAFQVYLDIHKVLLKEMSRGQAHLSTATKKIALTLERHFKSSEGIRNDAWPKENDYLLHKMAYDIKTFVQEDFLGPVRENLYTRQGLDASSLETYCLLKNQPILCGTILFRFNLQMHINGIVLGNSWASVPSLLHLYNAVHQEEVCREWGDSEFLIDCHTAERIFVGGKPQDAQDYLKRMLLVIGTPASHFATNKQKGSKTILGKPRKMMELSTFAEVFYQRYCRGLDDHYLWEHDGQRKPVTELEHPELSIANIEKFLFENEKPKRHSKPTDIKKKIALQEQIHFSGKMSPEDTLFALENAMVAEAPSLNFDYFSMHRRCWRFLRELRTDFHDDFVKYCGADYLVDEFELPMLVTYLFVISAESAKVAEELNLIPRGEKGFSKTLHRAGKFLDQLVMREGEAELQKVLDNWPIPL